MSADKGKAAKNASEGVKKARGSSRGGKGGPKRGSPTAPGGADILATTTFESLSGSPAPQVAIAGPSDQNEDTSPMYVGKYPRRVSQLNKFRAPAMKNVGKDKDGKVIPHFRSEEIAAIVLHYIGMGASENFICAHLNIRPGLLKSCYAKELEHGAERANMEVAGAAFRMATSEEDGAMTKFWMKSRNKWRDGDNADDKSSSLFNINIHI